MELSLTIDDFGQLVGTLRSEEQTAVLMASDVPTAIADLDRTLAEAEDGGYGECFWQTSLGDFRWVLRRTGSRVTVVALRSHGTVTGWQHLLHAETDFEPFAARLRAELAQLPTVL